VIKTIVINLDKDADRLLHMRAQLDAAGLEFERFPALRGDALPDCLQRLFAKDAELSLGEIGCYASHLAILRKVADGEIAAPVLVLEDDLAIEPGLGAMIESMLQALPPDWDFVRLSNQPRWTVHRFAKLGDGKWLCRYSEVPGSTGASLVSLSGARKFIEGRVRRFPVDQDLRRPWAWGLNMFGVAPAPITPDVLPQSSISTISPSTRARLGRQAAEIRNKRTSETLARWRTRIVEFGAVGFVVSLFQNAALALRKKHDRTNAVLLDLAGKSRP
jgi:glycosyl transferase, family 25